VGPCIVNVFLSMTNKMQRCIILFITVNALHVSNGFSAHHQELKSVHVASGICQTCLLLLLKPVPTHPRNRVEKKREDHERVVCLKKHRRTMFKPTPNMKRGVVIFVISCILHILSHDKRTSKFNPIRKEREDAVST
jgi:hypothetical protein